MPSQTPIELEQIARKYVAKHFPALQEEKPSLTQRQAKTPGAEKQYIFDFTGMVDKSPQRVRLVLDADGQVLKVAASR